MIHASRPCGGDFYDSRHTFVKCFGCTFHNPDILGLRKIFIRISAFSGGAIHPGGLSGILDSSERGVSSGTECARQPDFDAIIFSPYSVPGLTVEARITARRGGI